jgi:hypothetical protein
LFAAASAAHRWSPTPRYRLSRAPDRCGVNAFCARCGCHSFLP